MCSWTFWTNLSSGSSLLRLLPNPLAARHGVSLWSACLASAGYMSTCTFENLRCWGRATAIVIVCEFILRTSLIVLWCHKLSYPLQSLYCPASIFHAALSFQCLSRYKCMGRFRLVGLFTDCQEMRPMRWLKGKKAMMTIWGSVKAACLCRSAVFQGVARY